MIWVVWDDIDYTQALESFLHETWAYFDALPGKGSLGQARTAAATWWGVHGNFPFIAYNFPHSTRASHIVGHESNKLIQASPKEPIIARIPQG